MVSLPSRSDFWGVELTAKKKEAIWDAEDEDDGTRDDPDIVHTLHIQRIVLGANASKEDHLVTITAQNFAGNDLTHPLCWLNRKSISESQCSMHMALSPPVTLNLAQGSGPVHVIGIWEQQLEEDTYSSEGEDDEMDGQTDALDSKPFKDIDIKQKKRPATSPPTKPAKVAKKDEKTSKSVVPQQKKRIAEQDSDEEDDEDEDDEEDNENDEEEEEESDEEEDEESEEEPSPPPKKKPQTKAFTPKQKANTPKSIGDKAAKKPGKGATPPGPRSFEELKSLLAKSPQIPKKREKFNNFLQNNLKVSDPDMKNKLWNFVNKH